MSQQQAIDPTDPSTAGQIYIRFEDRPGELPIASVINFAASVINFALDLRAIEEAIDEGIPVVRDDGHQLTRAEVYAAYQRYYGSLQP